MKTLVSAAAIAAAIGPATANMNAHWLYKAGMEIKSDEDINLGLNSEHMHLCYCSKEDGLIHIMESFEQVEELDPDTVLYLVDKAEFRPVDELRSVNTTLATLGFFQEQTTKFFVDAPEPEREIAHVSGKDVEIA